MAARETQRSDEIPVLPGTMNGHAAGIIMKETVRRAVVAIRKQLHTFEATAKDSLTGREDFVTTADKAAQEVYVRSLRECFPGYGIVAEEDDLREPCSIPGEDIWFTVDPLDGTKAFMRRQSHAVGTMISLVHNGRVIAAYVADVMTQELYGFRPGSNSVHRISEFNENERLEVQPPPISESVVSLREEPQAYSQPIQQVARGEQFGGRFKQMQISGGSIGIDAARLWKGEIGALVMKPYPQTPWDYCPMIGISARLGFVEVEVIGSEFVPHQPRFIPEVCKRDHETILIHESLVPQLS